MGWADGTDPPYPAPTEGAGWGGSTELAPPFPALPEGAGRGGLIQNAPSAYFDAQGAGVPVLAWASGNAAVGVREAENAHVHVENLAEKNINCAENNADFAGKKCRF